MAPLRRIARRWAAVLAAGALAIGCAAAQESTDSQKPLRAELEQQLTDARQALSEARIEQAESAAQKALAALEDPGTPERAGLEPEQLRELRARALDLIAQARYSVGDAAGAKRAIEQMLEARPGHEVSGELVGDRYVKMVAERRSELVATLELNCQPVACAWVEVDGRRRDVGEGGEVALLAGTREVVVGRRNFERRVFEALELPAGERVGLEATMTPIARDLVVSTSPPGAEVTVDGEPIGRTVAPPAPAPSTGETVSAPLRVPSLSPGRHTLRFTAECRRPVEKTVDVVLDAMDPRPLRLGTIELAPASGVLLIAWPREAGTLSLDGAPVEAGRHEVCPGAHEVSLRLAQRPAWFETVEVADGQTVRLQPGPRPTLVLRPGDRTLLEEGVGDGWNTVVLAEAATRELERPLSRWADPELEVPEAPQPWRGRAEELVAAVRRAAPEADRFAAWLEAREGFRKSRRLVLADLRRSRVEIVAWTGAAAEALAAARQRLAPPRLSSVAFAGFDLAGLADGRVVIGSLHPEGPAAAAGLRVGGVLRAIGDEPVTGLADAEARRAEWTPGQSVSLTVLDAAAGERVVEFEPAGTIAVPRPGALDARAVLGELAHAEVAMGLGRGVERAAGTLFAGLALAALGETQAAATALDRASLDEATDPAQDARGTVWMVLEEQLRELAEGAYAAEVAARRRELGQARFGGRDGPPLRWASGDDE
jgi:hypothetical protein